MIAFGATIALSLSGCPGKQATEIRHETYQPAFRQGPPEPVYGRVTWSHLPGPRPVREAKKAPYLSPLISIELPNSNLEEAIQALAQTIGYKASYPNEVRSRKISLKRVGTVDDLLQEISRQARVQAEINHEHRLVRVIDPTTVPQLPE